MSKPLQNLTIAAPALYGLNTQDSPIEMQPSFASVADNLVVDEYGRLGARKGFALLTSDNTALGGQSISQVHEFEKEDGTRIILSTANNKVFTGTSTLTDITGASSISSDNWNMVTFNGKCYMFQSGHTALTYDGTTLANNSTAPEGNTVLAAFGRIWTADIVNDKQTVYWSDLLDGTSWSTGSSGSLNLDKVWPDGYDEITALQAYNNYLVIFGKNSIVIYSQAEDPASMVLADTINGIGCIDRNTVQQTGTDLVFLSNKGVQSFGRLLQQKSLPLRDISKNVRDDIVHLTNQETEGFRSVYNPTEAFYLLTFLSQDITYCFDLRGSLEDGSQRVTTWTNSPFKCYAFAEDTTMYVGNTNGIGRYFGYSDNNTSYRIRYYSHHLSFGDASVLKILKKIKPVLIGGGNVTATLFWGYDHETAYKSQAVKLSKSTPAYFGVGEYGIAEYTGGITITKPNINATGSGATVSVGVEAPINGEPLSLQQLNIQAIVGKMV